MFYCDADINCSVNKQNLFVCNLCITMKFYINHLEYLKYILFKKIESFVIAFQNNLIFNKK